MHRREVVLFLDIDGVLNTGNSCKHAKSSRLDHDKVQLLNYVLLSTGCSIVLSSAWRYMVHRGEMTLLGMDWLLRSHGVVADRLIGVTAPDSQRSNTVYNGDPLSWPLYNERGKQIQDWLSANECTQYAVVDDTDLGISEYGHPFVQTDTQFGLTPAEAYMLKELLENSTPDRRRTYTKYERS